jgi:hypothetical protein
MKEIKILQNGVDPIIIHDDDEMELGEYTKKISSLLEMANVAILETSSRNIIVRPHKLVSIEVSECESEKIDGQTQEDPPTILEGPKYVDMIIDGDEKCIST